MKVNEYCIDINRLKKNGASASSISEAVKYNKKYTDRAAKKKSPRKKVKKKKVVSFGENEVAKYLKSSGIKFQKEKEFPGLVSKLGNPLRFDFYLPEHNSIIEYDGIHHFKKTDYSSNLGKVKARDEVKNRFCKKNGIPILRITRKDLSGIDKVIRLFLL